MEAPEGRPCVQICGNHVVNDISRARAPGAMRPARFRAWLSLAESDPHGSVCFETQDDEVRRRSHCYDSMSQRPSRLPSPALSTPAR